MVGWADTRAGARHGFRWESGHLEDLGTDDAFKSTSAFAINNRNQIVGDATKPSGAKAAFLWTAGTLHDLNELIGRQRSKWNLEYANDVNDTGWVVGVGLKDGVQHYYLARPRTGGM